MLLASYDVKSTEPLFEPYGAKFGQEFDINQHKTMARRGNVRTVKLRTTNRPDDTEELLAEICDDYGLQVITWRSHIRSPSSALVSHNDILNRLKKKFGTPKIKHKSAFWTLKDLTIVVKIRDENITIKIRFVISVQKMNLALKNLSHILKKLDNPQPKNNNFITDRFSTSI